MKALLHPTYFPSIAHFVSIVNNERVVFEVADNYQKQTYRNRAYIYGANGKQLLTVPIKHIGNNGRQKYKDVKVEYSFPWQKQHWKTLQTAYRTSPFFEFYEDDLAFLFENKETFLIDLNFKTIEIVSDCFQLKLNYEKTTSYKPEVTDIKDYRDLVRAKNEVHYPFECYTQVFGEKHGFLSNLSILDLLFNEGTNTINYLKNQKTNFQ
ncbi:WbqC family protein [Leptobacterium sp. I13]|uniref:WbqC family protein n=1 Tax=Leptobacterium meishanense TaxID=3128904 RepID=UPI0030EBA474